MDAAAIHKLSSDGGAVVMQEQVQVRSPPDASDLLHDVRLFGAGSGQVIHVSGPGYARPFQLQP